MRINELIRSFEIYASNEEKSVLEQIDRPLPVEWFKEREQVVIQNLVRKSLVSKISKNGYTYVMRND
jgi:hypothetical protein